MCGRKYQIGKYPGMKRPLTNNDWFEREVFDIHDPAGILEQLDKYEGPDYRGKIQQATLRTGRPVDCWVYLCLDEVLDQNAQPPREGPCAV